MRYKWFSEPEVVNGILPWWLHWHPSLSAGSWMPVAPGWEAFESRSHQREEMLWDSLHLHPRIRMGGSEAHILSTEKHDILFNCWYLVPGPLWVPQCPNYWLAQYTVDRGEFRLKILSSPNLTAHINSLKDLVMQDTTAEGSKLQEASKLSPNDLSTTNNFVLNLPFHYHDFWCYSDFKNS